MKHKYDAFNCFQQFKALMENQSGHCIKILRTGKGGEYVSNEFLNFCKTHGIQKQFTARYTPQQNGIAEKKNRTIMEMARSMLVAKHFPNEYWGEAVATAVYIIWFTNLNSISVKKFPLKEPLAISGGFFSAKK